MERTITAVPAGATRLDLYESANAAGPWALVAEIQVTAGQTAIDYEFQSGFWYRFQLYYESTGELSAFSSVWHNVVDDRLCVVTGKCLDPGGAPVAGVTVTATLLAQASLLADGSQVAGEVATLTTAEGDWALALARNAALADSFARYVITLSGKGFASARTVTIPDQEAEAFVSLPDAVSLSTDFDLEFEVDADSARFAVGEKKQVTVFARDATGRASALPGAAVSFRLDLKADGSEVLAWTAAEIDGMTLRYLLDAAGLTTGKYLARFRLVAGGETLYTPIFTVTVK